MEIVPENAPHRFGFIGTQEPIVDEDARQLVANRLVKEGGRHTRIDPAGKAKNDLIEADLLSEVLAGLLDERAHRPIHFAAADSVNEVGEDVLASRGVGDFRVELEAVELLPGLFDDGVRGIVRFADDLETAGKPGDLVAGSGCGASFP
jgi:hypothetical protein